MLTLKNIDCLTDQHVAGINEIGSSIAGKRGLNLIASLKRESLDHGPYRGVSLFEAANRIMSDMVILRGVRWLLTSKELPFDAYTVEFGNEDRNGFDLRASHGASTLVGEAFNVAPSFFQCKKASALKKLRRHGTDSTYRVVLVNEDAMLGKYIPRLEKGILLFSVDIVSGKTRHRASSSAR